MRLGYLTSLMQRHVLFWVKWASLGVSLGSILLAGVLMQLHGSVPVLKPGEGKQDTQTQVSSPLIVEKKGDRMVWRLQAKKAEQEFNGKMHLLSPELTLFTESDEAVPVQSREAWFDPIRRNIEFQGDVHIHFQQWSLTSQTVSFNSSRDELLIPGSFEVRGKTLQAKGKKLRLDRRSQRLWIDQGIWIKDESSAWQQPGH